MSEFTASEELITILLANGFTETTKIEYPQHYERIQRDGYDSNIHKREFKFGKSIVFKFDYINMSLLTSVIWLKAESKFSYNQVKSILVYCNLKPSLRAEFANSDDGYYRLHEKYSKIINNETMLGYKNNQKLVEAFEKINF